MAAIAAGGWRRASLTYWIFFAMLLGGEIGLDRPQFAEHLRVFSDIFLRLIKVIVAPLIFGTLVTGIAGHGNLRSVGRIGVKSLVYFEVVTTLALFIGLGAINISRAGEGLTVAAATATEAAPVAAPLHWDDFLLHIFPENLAKSVAENQILQVAVFSVLFGIALARISEAKRAPMLGFCESLTATMFAFTNLVMYFAPVGVGAAMAYTVGHMGIAVLLPLGKLLLTGYGALLFFLLAVLLPIALLARLPMGRFVRAVAEPATIAFATSTSEAALPRAMECDGRVRRAAAHCGVRDSGRIQLQPGRINAVSGGGVHFCGAGGGHSFDVDAAAIHGVYADGDEQGRGGSAARGAGGAAGDGGDVSSSHASRFSSFWGLTR